MTRGEYRLLIDLPAYNYDREYSALIDFQTTINNSQAVLDTLVQNLPNSHQETAPSFKDKLTILFHDIAGRLSRALVHFQLQRTTLAALISRHAEPRQPRKSSDSNISPDRGTRDVADYFGLASTAELAELNHFVTQLQNSETKLAHSAEQQITYLNRTMQRVNDQERRLNQLALLDIKWESVLQTLQKTNAAMPEYLDLLATLMHGSSVVNVYETEVRVSMDQDIFRLRQLLSRQMPSDLLSTSDFRNLLQESSAQLAPETFFTEPVDDLVTRINHLPLTLLHDPNTNRLVAKITIPTYDPSAAHTLYQIVPGPMANAELPGIQEIFDVPHTLLAVWHNQYFELDPHDLFDCDNPASNVRNFLTRDHLCGNIREVITYNAKSTLTSCTAALYFEPNVPVPQNCQTRVRVTPNSIFTHLKHNIWLYAPSQTDLLRFMCPGSTHAPVKLHSEGGLVTIPRGCSAVAGQVKLPAFFNVDQHLEAPNHTHYTFDTTKFTFWIHNVSIPEAADSHQLITKIQDALQHSTSLSMPLEPFKKTLHDISTELTQNSVSHFMHHNSAAPHASTIITTFILAALFVGLCCLGRCCWHRCRRPPTPQGPAAMPLVTFAPSATAMNAPGPALRILEASPPGESDRGRSGRTRSRTRRIPSPA